MQKINKKVKGNMMNWFRHAFDKECKKNWLKKRNQEQTTINVATNVNENEIIAETSYKNKEEDLSLKKSSKNKGILKKIKKIGSGIKKKTRKYEKLINEDIQPSTLNDNKNLKIKNEIEENQKFDDKPINIIEHKIAMKIFFYIIIKLQKEWIKEIANEEDNTSYTTPSQLRITFKIEEFYDFIGEQMEQLEIWTEDEIAKQIVKYLKIINKTKWMINKCGEEYTPVKKIEAIKNYCFLNGDKIMIDFNEDSVDNVLLSKTRKDEFKTFKIIDKIDLKDIKNEIKFRHFLTRDKDLIDKIIVPMPIKIAKFKYFEKNNINSKKIFFVKILFEEIDWKDKKVDFIKNKIKEEEEEKLNLYQIMIIQDFFEDNKQKSESENKNLTNKKESKYFHDVKYKFL